MMSVATGAAARLPSGTSFADVAALVGASIAPDGVRGWRLRPRGHAVEILVDDRLLLGASSQRRLVALASGAALYSLRLALADVGREVVVEMRPGPPEVLATAQAIETLRTEAVRSVPDDDARAKRSTATSATQRTMRALADAAEAEGAALVLLRHNMIVLASLDETIPALVRCGQAMQRIVIESALSPVGVSLSFEPFADARTRRRAAPTCSGAFPQVLVELS